MAHFLTCSDCRFVTIFGFILTPLWTLSSHLLSQSFLLLPPGVYENIRLLDKLTLHVSYENQADSSFLISLAPIITHTKSFAVIYRRSLAHLKPCSSRIWTLFHSLVFEVFISLVSQPTWRSQLSSSWSWFWQRSSALMQRAQALNSPADPWPTLCAPVSVILDCQQ